MSQLLSLAGWYFLPNLVSGWTQTALYSIFIRAGEPHPQPGSPRFIKHRRIIQISVILLYLAYTVYEADWELQREGDFYRILNVDSGSEERRIKSIARRLLAQAHPDKTDSGQTDQFILIKTASDALGDPIKRWAYDRFGPSVLKCSNCITLRDYVNFGFSEIWPLYVASAVGLWLLYFIGYMQTGKYARFLAMALLCTAEGFIATRAPWPGLLSKVINPFFSTLRLRRAYLPFQAIAVLRKLVITAFVAHSQIMPLLMPERKSDDEQQLRANLQRIQALAQHQDQELSLLLKFELTPFFGDEQEQEHLRQRLQEWLVHNTVAANPEVRDARGRAIERRRVGAPHGAKGTT